MTTRRHFLASGATGTANVALAWLLNDQGLLGETDRPELQKRSFDTRPKKPSGTPRARAMISLWMQGGPSHIDLFDPKPLVNRLAGQPLPAHIKRPYLPMGETDSPILASPRQWRRHGKSGLPVSEWMPHIGARADDLCLLRSCVADGLLHVRGVTQMNTGSVEAGRPSLGSWCVYGLGTENDSLPAFVVLLDRDREPPGGPRNWGSAFMPATYQGTKFLGGDSPILHLRPPVETSTLQQRRKLELIGLLNRRHAAARENTELEARIANYELAYRMQAGAPEAVDLSRESAETKRLYGIDEEPTETFGGMCLMARRLVERGVRFVQLYSGSGSKWDSHSHIEKNHSALCRSIDKPVAGLLDDLKRRGLLEETLVVWGGEFGRTPQSEKGDGRDHNPFGFSMWLAGGGVQGGQVIGATDELGLHAIERPIHVHDLHATILHLLGLNHEELTFLHNSREDRLTDVYGKVVQEVLA